MWNNNSERERLNGSTRPNTIRQKRSLISCCCFSLISSIVISTLIIISVIIIYFNSISSYPNDKWIIYHNQSYIIPEVSKITCKSLYDEIKPYNDRYEKSIQSDIIKLLFNQSFIEKFNETSVFYKAQEAYLICKKTNPAFYEQLIDQMTTNVFKSHSGKSLTESIIFLMKEFNFNTFFNLEIMPNLGEGSAMLIYLSPNPAFYKNDEMLEYKNISKNGLNLYEKLRNISVASNDDTSKWQIWNLNSSTDFNFTTFFYQLLSDNNQQNANFTDFKFVITNPEYIKKLEKVLIETSSLEMQALFLTALKESVKNYNCDKIFEDFIPHIANILYLSLNNDTVIQEARDKLITDFQKLITVVKSLIQPYLHTKEQQKLVEEKLKNVEITTDAPNWLQLDDSIDRLNNEYLQLSPRPTLLELQKFAFQKKLSNYQTIHEALRSFEYDSIPMSSNKIYYSEMGNWLTIPIATFLQYNNYGNNYDRMILEMATNIAKIVSFDSFRWSATGTERNFKTEILSLNLKEQNYCLKIHKISKEDYSILLGLEASRELLTNGLTGIEKRNVTKQLANFVAQKNTNSSIRISAGFLERHHENLCKNENILPCFI